MKSQLQKIKLVFIFLILTFSFIIVFCPIGKSGPIDPIYDCYPILIIDYDPELVKEPIIPFNETRSIPVKIKARITGPAADIVVDTIAGEVLLIVDLFMADVPEGVHASITPPIVQFPLSTEFEIQNATISITVNKDLPAAAQKDVIVRLESRKLGKQATLVRKVNITQEIPFIIGYYPKLSFVYLDGNVRNISPEETASFNFEIQNWGNSATNVVSEVFDLPEDWSAEIARSTVLGSEIVGGTSKKIISFRVKPPIDFGYHEDRAIIKVSMIPKSELTSEDIGEPHYLYYYLH